jgi:GT2 family glycosyltransferase
MADYRTIFDEPHHQSLELLATRALAEGNPLAAFKFADRRCRILPLAEPYCYVLRGEASFRLGAKASAIADLKKALEIAPDDIAANRRMLAWAEGSQRKRAALALIDYDRDFNALRKAIHVLQNESHRNFAGITVLENAIEGWAVWQDDVPLELSISNGVHHECKTYEADPFHPLADCGRALSFKMRRPKSAGPQWIVLSSSGNVLRSLQAPGNIDRTKRQIPSVRPVKSSDQKVTVIVPIYGDYNATRSCLDGLRRELNSSHTAILIDDATPNSDIAKYLAAVKREPHFRILTNTRNLGFTGSVNRALCLVTQGDIIILNSDTIVPPGFISRLTAAARSSLDIGTVTPLSNNGELTSFPIPNIANPLGSPDDVERIDRIAAEVNAGIIVDIPSGIGFCLYIRRPCLESVGLLSEIFSPGYLEDADFCLRARGLGFRSVCTPSVYVGHAGSKSFGSKKRSLVVRNLAEFERRFPNHRMECATFMAADPLRSARQAIEQTAAAIVCHPALLVTGSDNSATARARARKIGTKFQPALISEVENRTEGAIVRIINPSGDMPQSLQFNLASSIECQSLSSFLKCNEPSQIEFIDPANTPFQLVDLLVRLEVAYDIFAADAGLLGPQSEHLLISAIRAEGVPQVGTPVSVDSTLKALSRTDHWWRILEGARQILVPSPQARAFAATTLPRHMTNKIRRTYDCRRSTERRLGQTTVPHLGLVPLRSCRYEQQLMVETARLLGRIRPDISITVVGSTRDDIELMRITKAFVTGAVGADEFEELIDALGITCLFITTVRPLFAHPVLSSVFSSGAPIAYFDWSMGNNKVKKMDLAIHPSAPLDDVIDALSRWIPRGAQTTKASAGSQ